jgi:hypothetical protein
MSNRQPFPALVCKSCLYPIPLPPAMRPDTFEGLGSWPTGGVIRNFLCPQCKRVYEYSAHDVQFLPVGRDPRREGMFYNVMSILLPCGVEGCGTLLTIRTILASDTDAHEKALEQLVASSAHEIHCDGRQHMLNGPILPFGTAFDVMYDDDWEISGVQYP